MRSRVQEDNLPESSAGSLGLHDSRKHGAALAGLITPAGQQERRLLKVEKEVGREGDSN
jgi:hypothetical protein